MDTIREMLDEELRYALENSSYVKKVLKKQTPLVSADRTKLENLYKKAREYACTSIISHLNNFNGMDAGKVYHLDCKKDHFFILARVRTNYEKSTIEETAKERDYLSFSILTEKNLSHYPGRVLYGYQGISPQMIGFIYHHDADTYAYATTRLELSELPEELLDIEDLCNGALSEKTYCELSIQSKIITYTGPIMKTDVLFPSVVVSVDAPTHDDLLAATQRKLPILVLHRSPKTIMNIHDMFFTQELSNPMLI